MSDCKKKVYRRSSCGPIEVGDGKITVKYLGKEVGRFTVDQCSDALIDIAPDGAGDPALWEQFAWCEDCFYWCEPRAKLNCDPCPDEEDEFDEVAPYDDCGDCPDGGWGLDWECAIDKLIDHGLWDKLPWEEWPICDDCFVYCDNSGRSWTRPEVKSALETFPQQLLLNAAKPEPTPVPAKKKTTVLKFSSSNCGICGRMAKFDQRAIEQLGYEFQTVKRSDPEDWEKYQYVLDQIYGPEDVIGFPSYIAVEGTSETDMVALGEVRGGMDKGKFKEKIQLVIKDRGSEPRVEPGDENCKYWKVRCRCGCIDDEGESGSNPIWSIKYYEDENLPGSNDDYDVISTHEDVEACKSSKCGAAGLGCMCDFSAVEDGDPGVGLCTLTCYKKKDEGDPCKDAGAECGTVDGESCGDCPAGKKCENNKCVDDEPAGCDKDFTLVLDCPKDCDQASGTRTINATADGIANSNVDFKWYEGSAGGGTQIGSGTSVSVNCPPAGQSQKFACQATYKEGACDITRTENCTISTSAAPEPEPEPDYQCKPNDCGTIQGIDCGGCENGFECRGNECVEVEKPPYVCKPDDCGNVQGTDCGNCPEGQKCVNGKCEDDVQPPYQCKTGDCGTIQGVDCGDCPEGQKCVGGKCEDDTQPPYQCQTDDCGVIQGVNCGGCPEGQQCVNGKCEDIPPYQCKQGDCGNVNGSDCGDCPEGQTCQGGRCVDVSNPCDGKECGTWGGQQCGDCPEGKTCQNGRCVDVTPPPTDPCEGRDCGTGTDGVTNCGDCTEGSECQNGVCVDVTPPPTDPCQGIECGTGTDGTTDCGSCVEGSECQNGVCVEVIDPCEGINCGIGTDGVTECGTCEDGYECDGGECIPSVQFECPTDCSGWSIDWKCVHDKMAAHGNVLKAGPRITLAPSHGNLWLSDITVSAAGNTGGGVDVIYDPIFIDFEEQGEGEADYWDDRAKHFDYFGSRGIQEAESFIPYMVKDVEKSRVFTLTDVPAEANGAFVEINFRGEHTPSATFAQKHPSYLLDNTVETLLEFKNLLDVTGGEFVSGLKDSMHNNMGLHVSCKLDPVSLSTTIQVSSNRQQKLNFMDFAAGASITMQTKVYVIHYHYTSAAMGLGRAKVTPVKYNKTRENIELIQRQLDDFNLRAEYGTADKYYEKPADITRMQGADLRQAVDQLNSAIDFKLAIGGGNTAQIQQLRSDLNSQVLQGSGNFETIRDRLTALKTTAKNLGVIGLTKLESDNGVDWLQPGDTNHPL